MEPFAKVAAFRKVRNLSVIQPMQTQRIGSFSRTDRIAVLAALLSGLLTRGFPFSGYARQISRDQAQPHKNTAPDTPSPPAGAMPSGDAKNGVLKPPDVDPKMAKPVPDVDPAMDNPPPGKDPARGDSVLPKVQPK
jgi:hypothetical protein